MRFGAKDVEGTIMAARTAGDPQLEAVAAPPPDREEEQGKDSAVSRRVKDFARFDRDMNLSGRDDHAGPLVAALSADGSRATHFDIEPYARSTREHVLAVVEAVRDPKERTTISFRTHYSSLSQVAPAPRRGWIVDGWRPESYVYLMCTRGRNSPQHPSSSEDTAAAHAASRLSKLMVPLPYHCVWCGSEVLQTINI